MKLNPLVTNKLSINYFNLLESTLKEKHNNRYTYTDSIYTNAKAPFIVTCKEHGNFVTTVSNHLGKGTNCPKCVGGVAYDTKWFIDKTLNKFGDKFSFEDTNYVNSTTPIIVNCNKHGSIKVFQQAFFNNSQGCSECSCPTITYEDICKRFIEVHGNEYGYSAVKYINMHTKVEIFCNTCNTAFFQEPNNHLAGNKCPTCYKGGFSKDSPGILYYLSVNNGEAYKIGITNRTVKERYLVRDRPSYRVLKEWFYSNGYEALLKEAEILNTYKEYKYTGPNLLSSGNTELFSIDILNLDTSS